MKILLINPGSKFLIDEKVFPSLGLLYLSAYLKENGYTNISLLDMCGDEVPNKIDADVVGICSNTPQFPSALRIIDKIKKTNIQKDAVYVFGGPHVSGRPEDVPKGDIAVVGEGEDALLSIIKNKEIGKKSENVVQYKYRDNINNFPFPDRDILDIKSYKYFIDGKLTTTLITSRGCPFGCRFCANEAWGKTLRMRNPENIFDEVKMLKDKYGYESFMFFDDTMTVNKKRINKICELIKPLNIIYRCFIRSDTVNIDILQKMRDSGCVEVGIGIESGSQRILDIVNKGETVEKNIEAIGYCHDVGLRVKGFLIIGLPGENEYSIRETKEFLKKTNLDDVDFSVFMPYPGSYIYKNRESFDILFKDNYKDSWYKGKTGEYTSLVSTSCFSAEEIVGIRNELEKKYKKGKH